jgi:phage recombination protein Bet
MSTGTALAEFKPQQTNLINLDSPTTIDTIKNSICKGANNDQLNSFLMLARHFNLNPFNKEIYFSSQIGVFVGRHGMLRIANRHPDFLGLKSAVIREKDDFQVDYVSGQIIKHVSSKGNGKVVGAWAHAIRKGHTTLPVICYIDEFSKNNPAWNGYAQDMISYKAETRALRNAFNSEFEGINTIDPEEEFRIETRPSFSESHSPAVGALTMDDYLGDDEPASAAVVEPEKTKPHEDPDEEFIDNGQKANFAIKQNEYGIPDEVIAGWLIENGYSPTGSRATIYKSKFLEAKKGLKGLAKELANKQPESLDDAIKQQKLSTETPNTDFLDPT